MGNSEMPDFVWAHAILIVGVLMLAALCFRVRAHDERVRQRGSARAAPLKD